LTEYCQQPHMARGKGKRGGGRGSGKRFAAQSAEEIETRNERLAAFDAARALRRADADAEKDASDDDSVDSAQREAEREAMLVGRRVAGISVGDDEDGEWVEKEYKPKGVEGIIETDNPNKQKVKNTKLKDMGGEAAPMTRKEREEKEKEAKAAAYRKRHEAGLTEEYQRDMAKLNEVKERRAAAEAKAAVEKEMEDLRKEDRKKTHGVAVGAASDDEEGGGEGKKKKKSKAKGPPKIDKIAIKKMKTAQLKQALKERELDIQGNAKVLQARLLKYEEER